MQMQTPEAVEEAPREAAISVREVTKKFRLHNDRKTNVKELFSSRDRRSRHEEF